MERTLSKSRSLNGKYLSYIVVRGILKVFLSDSHSLGHMQDIMDVILTTHKEKHLETVEKTICTKKRKKAYKLITKFYY